MNFFNNLKISTVTLMIGLISLVVTATLLADSIFSIDKINKAFFSQHHEHLTPIVHLSEISG